MRVLFLNKNIKAKALNYLYLHSCSILGEKEVRHGTDKSDVVCSSSLPSTKPPKGMFKQNRLVVDVLSLVSNSRFLPNYMSCLKGFISPFSSYHIRGHLSLLTPGILTPGMLFI